MVHQSFVDWMKAVGMLLIVTGHIIGSPYHIFNEVSQPVYTKQLGVAFFVFVMGWGLANEKRTGLRVVYNRIFPMYFYGGACALLVSCIFYFTNGDLNESNYLPFFLGANVLLNYFPANPTTWYIGTYIHIVLFWFFFIQGKEITKRHLLYAFVCENLVRCLLVAANKDFIAYMLLPNWLTVFLLGCYLRNKKDAVWQPIVYLLVFAWICFIVFWSSALNGLSFDDSFPFRVLQSPEIWSLPVRSLLISGIYLASTVVAFEIFRRLPLYPVVAFFARNTLIIFIAHMPLIYGYSDAIYGLFGQIWIGELVVIVLMYVGLAILSEGIQRAINTNCIRDYLWQFVEKFQKFITGGVSKSSNS